MRSTRGRPGRRRRSESIPKRFLASFSGSMARRMVVSTIVGLCAIRGKGAGDGSTPGISPLAAPARLGVWLRWQSHETEQKSLLPRQHVEIAAPDEAIGMRERLG